jgi:coenzyme F420 hydrogenase subunit beta
MSNSIPLRKTGIFVSPLKVLNEPTEPPRALKSLAQIIDNGLCHRCGSCVGICPTKVLGLDSEEYPEVHNLNACTDCDLCVRVCPGDEFSAPSIAKELFKKPPEPVDTHGSFMEASISYAVDKDIRYHSSSGGLVTGLLLSMLEAGEIDGALVVCSDDKVPWKGKPIIARTKDDLISSLKSKYAISPTNVAFQEIIQTEGRYAIVGLPCQIHGFRKAAKLNKKLNERIVLSIGIFCHAAVEHEPMHWMWNNVIKDNQSVKKYIPREGKHPGTPYIEKNDGSTEPVYFPQKKGYRPSSTEMLNILYRLYTPARCMTCYDSTAEFADIAVGDPWMTPPNESIDFYDGYSFTLARTDAGTSAMKRAEERKDIIVVPIREDQARKSNIMMAVEKKNRAWRVIETRRRQGLAIPDYDFKTPKIKGKHLIETEIGILTHIFCFMGWGKITLLKLAYSELGYFLLKLNYYRREFRNWRRDRRNNKKERELQKEVSGG